MLNPFSPIFSTAFKFTYYYSLYLLGRGFIAKRRDIKEKKHYEPSLLETLKEIGSDALNETIEQFKVGIKKGKEIKGIQEEYTRKINQKKLEYHLNTQNSTNQEEKRPPIIRSKL